MKQQYNEGQEWKSWTFPKHFPYTTKSQIYMKNCKCGKFFFGMKHHKLCLDCDPTDLI